jgi:hypothetical protein
VSLSGGPNTIGRRRIVFTPLAVVNMPMGMWGLSRPSMKPSNYFAPSTPRQRRARMADGDRMEVPEALVSAWLAGFAASAEGYNAEYPFDGDFRDDADLNAEARQYAETRLPALYEQIEERLLELIPSALFDPGRYVEREHLPAEVYEEDLEHPTSWQFRAIRAALHQAKGGEG